MVLVLELSVVAEKYVLQAWAVVTKELEKIMQNSEQVCLYSDNKLLAWFSFGHSNITEARFIMMVMGKWSSWWHCIVDPHQALSF